MKRALWIAGPTLGAGMLLAGCAAPQQRSEREPSAPPKSATAPLSSQQSSAEAPSVDRRPLPPYHQSPEAAKPFPRLMPVERYRGYPLIARAYEIAHRMPEVLVQQPCYCYCDKFGHRSLLDCYASDHGAG